MSANNPQDRPVLLVGFMGAGKTSVGRALAQLLLFSFIDLDDVIESRAGKKISEIFAEQGEAEFRRLEREALESCRELKQTVIALGGGTFVAEENRRTLRSIGPSVWLDCPFEVCLSRIEGDRFRPMLRSREETEKLFRSRLDAYALADFTVDSNEDTVEEIAARIAQIVFR